MEYFYGEEVPDAEEGPAVEYLQGENMPAVEEDEFVEDFSDVEDPEEWTDSCLTSLSETPSS